MVSCGNLLTCNFKILKHLIHSFFFEKQVFNRRFIKLSNVEKINCAMSSLFSKKKQTVSA